MKKVIILFVSLSLVFFMSACGGTTDTKPTISGAGEVNITINESFIELDGVTAADEEDGNITKDITTSGTVDTTKIGTYTVTYMVKDADGNEFKVVRTVNVVGLDGCPVHHDMVDGTCVKQDAQTVTIMHGAVYEIDPFHEDYSGTETAKRRELQREVEAKYNVVVKYKNYPSSAAWGPDRIQAINQASVAGEPLSDIYWVTSNWIQTLVTGDSITSVSDYMASAGKNIPDAYNDVGEYQGSVYGFESYRPTVSAGLYYNADLVADLGVENPTDLYLEGKWNWSKFETWSTSVQTALDSQPDDMYALGGMLSYYAKHMMPLNGGSLINKSTEQVAFGKPQALETYAYLSNLWDKGLFEPNSSYDAGSPEWQSGKVVMHPGELWFVKSDARWGGLSFDIEFVPYPVADDFDVEKFQQPISGVALMTVASGMTPEKEELVFTVWNELQLFEDDATAALKFKFALVTKFNSINSVNAYMEIYDKVYLDVTDAIGIGAYSDNGWTRNINAAIKEGTSRTVVDTIRPTYEQALLKYLGNTEE